jgi:hypothetical protein
MARFGGKHCFPCLPLILQPEKAGFAVDGSVTAARQGVDAPPSKYVFSYILPICVMFVG